MKKNSKKKPSLKTRFSRLSPFKKGMVVFVAAFGIIGAVAVVSTFALPSGCSRRMYRQVGGTNSYYVTETCSGGSGYHQVGIYCQTSSGSVILRKGSWQSFRVAAVSWCRDGEKGVATSAYYKNY